MSFDFHIRNTAGKLNGRSLYTPNGFADKVFHLHIQILGDNGETYFRNYLIENPEIAKEYEKLKVDLKEKFEHDRDMYTLEKSSFIKKVY